VNQNTPALAEALPPDPPADPGVAVIDVLYRGYTIVDHSTRSLAPDMTMVVAEGGVVWVRESMPETPPQ
jgi:hypothetical protein